MTRKTLRDSDARRLAGLVVVVTGSSRGIGRETARVLLEAGATVVLNGRDAERLAAVREELAAGDSARHDRAAADTGGTARVSAVSADISEEAGAREMVEHALGTWGRIDVLVNNAGISMRGPIRELRADTLDRLVSGNLRSAVLATVAALPYLLNARGRVLFVSTVAALHGFPGVSLYSAAKAAVERFAEALAAEHAGSGLSVGTVFLGFVENDADKQTVAADGHAFHHRRKAMQSQRAAALHIARALSRRRTRSISVPVGRVFDLAHRLAPRATTRLLGRSGGSVHSVGRS
jgi:NAD(P)-dependent dehydrogenase (short-subunit alcohol dehydrogenase family)